MRSIPLLLLAIACSGTDPEPPADDTDTDLPLEDTADTDSQFDERWDTSIDVDPGADTFQQGDAPIGRTALDGPWHGTFSFTQVLALARDPRCQGTVEFEIDGGAARHVRADLYCPTWNPRPPSVVAQFSTWGPLEGLGLATLNPTALDRFELDLSLRADHMAPVELPDLEVVVSGDEMSASFTEINGIGAISFGVRFNMDLVRGPAPVDTGSPVVPVDTGSPVVPVDTGPDDTVDTALPISTDTSDTGAP